MGIGSSLRTLIEERGTNVHRVSIETGVKASTLYSIIQRDSTKVDLDDLQKLADYLGVSISYFAATTLHNDDTHRHIHSVAPDSSWSTPLVDAYATKPAQTQENVCKLLDIPHVIPEESTEDDNEYHNDYPPFDVDERLVDERLNVKKPPA